MLKLYSSWMGSSAYRARIALALKGLDYELVPVQLKLRDGEQHGPAYRRINPQGMVPVLVDGDHVLTQSLAIMEYLDEAYPDSYPLLPQGTLARARVRALTLAVACDIQPLGVVRIRDYIANEIQLPQAQQQQWLRHWAMLGFEALEIALQSPETGRCCHGDMPGMADCVLIPQVYKAHEMNMDMSPYPTVERIYQYCQTLDAFTKTRPDRQPDAPRG